VRLSVVGAGAGPDLFLVHGWGMNSAIVEPFASDLAGSWRVTVVELPGHGRSPWDPGWRGLAEWADVCLAVAPERASWVGWSLGGLIGIEAAARAAGRVLGLRLISSTPCFTRRANWWPAIEAQVLDGFANELVADPVATLRRFLALQVRGSEDGRAALRALQAGIQGSPAPHAEALLKGLAILRDSDLRGVLKSIPCPVDWLFGERDTLVPAAAAAEIAEISPGSSVTVVTGAGHAPLLSHPSELRAWIGEPRD